MLACYEALLAVCASFIAAASMVPSSLFAPHTFTGTFSVAPSIIPFHLIPPRARPDESEDQIDYKWDCNMLRGKILNYLMSGSDGMTKVVRGMRCFRCRLCL